MASGRITAIAMEGDLSGDSEITAYDQGVFQVLGHGRDLGQRVVPASHLVERLTKDALCLGYPKRRPDLVRELPRTLCCGQRLVPPVEITQRDRLVDLQEQPEVVQR